MRRLCIALALTALATSASAGVSSRDTVDRFHEANEEYLAANYERAQFEYEQLLEIAPRDPVLLFNMGNAFYHLGETGWAVWCYEMALRMRPGWDEAEHNLRLVAPPTSRGSVLGWPVQWARRSVALQTWSWAAAVSWALTLLLAAGAFAFTSPGGRRLLRRLTAIGAVSMVLALCALTMTHRERTANPASIVVAASAQVRSGPGPESGSPMGDLAAGSRVWKVGEAAPNGWVKIHTDAGQLGFVDQTALCELRERETLR